MLAPRYRLVYRNIAPSLGLQMARRLGFPPPLLDEAERQREHLGVDLAAAAGALEVEGRNFEERARAARDERAALEASRDEYSGVVADRTKQKRRWADELEQARRFADDLRRQVSACSTRRASAQQLGQRLREVRRGARTHRRTRACARRRDRGCRRGCRGTPPRVGDEVQVVGSGLRGRLESVPVCARS
jgi:dsDNA-specific endonuclease/ATPase MutS2